MQGFLGPGIGIGAAGGPIGIVVTVVGTILSAIFGAIFGAPDLSSLVNAVNNLASQVTAAINAVMKFAWAIAQAVGALFNILKAIWGNVIKKLIQIIRGIVDQINRVLNKILKPILDAQKAMRDAILDIYNRFIRPIIVFIQKFRTLIHLFQLLHIHIFDGIDKALARIEGKLLAPIYALLYRSNTLTNWISFILNARLLIYRALLLGSMTANAGGAFGVVMNAPATGTARLPYTAPGIPIGPGAASYTAFSATANTTLVDQVDVIESDASAGNLVALLTQAPTPAGQALISTLDAALALDAGVTP